MVKYEKCYQCCKVNVKHSRVANQIGADARGLRERLCLAAENICTKQIKEPTKT